MCNYFIGFGVIIMSKYRRYKSNKVVKAKFDLVHRPKDTFSKLRILLISLISVVAIVAILLVANEFIKVDRASVDVGTHINGSEIVEIQTSEIKKKLLTIASLENPLDEEYELNLKSFDDVQCDELVIQHLKEMINSAQKSGYNLKVIKGYISKQEQDEAYNNKVSKFLAEGYSQVRSASEASKIVPPGNKSEYQTGLSIDIVYSGYNESVDFSKTPEYSWLVSNCVNYGFILRYPEGKTGYTGVNFDPKCFRYVGVENAKNIRAKYMCLEEYVRYVNIHKR